MAKHVQKFLGDIMAQPNVLILYGDGINCDYETKDAVDKSMERYARIFGQCRLNSDHVHRTHLNVVDHKIMKDHQILLIPGGFSRGDYPRAGVGLGIYLIYDLYDDILEFIEDGKLIMGTCNGLQALAASGILPATDGNYTNPTAALWRNDSGRFIDTWVELEVNPNSPCVFTRGVKELYLPIRHGEGKFVAPEEVLDQMERQNQIVLTYAEGNNFNGSLRDIAGICDRTGRVFGKMPHAEAFTDEVQHPRWTRERPDMEKSGILIYMNMVEYFSEN
jgi:phosphoribosylformylglycinamidine synthase